MELDFEMPVFHSTQLTTLALGMQADDCHFDENLVDPLPLLRSKKLFCPLRFLG